MIKINIFELMIGEIIKMARHDLPGWLFPVMDGHVLAFVNVRLFLFEMIGSGCCSCLVFLWLRMQIGHVNERVSIP